MVLEAAISAGFKSFLTKPLKKTDLLECVYECLSGKPLVEVCAYRPSEVQVAPNEKYRILVAEDNSVNQLLAMTLLKKLGYAAQCVANGKEVLDVLAHSPVDLILMDCQMPEMDGYEATRKIREQEKVSKTHLPIIALTANAMKDDVDRSFKAGMDGYGAKPFKREHLSAAIERLLPHHRAAN